MTFFWISYGVIALVLIRPLAGHLAYREAKKNSYYQRCEPEWSWGIFCAVFLVLAWPVIVIFYVSGRVLPKAGAEREIQMEAQRKRIEQLERELDLR